jgi:hypothetical protein
MQPLRHNVETRIKIHHLASLIGCGVLVVKTQCKKCDLGTGYQVFTFLGKIRFEGKIRLNRTIPKILTRKLSKQ